MKTRGLGRKENHGIYIDKRQVLKILESYIIDLYSQATLLEPLEVISEEEATADEKSPYICAVKYKQITIRGKAMLMYLQMYSNC
jgi:hypothetical protein